MIPRFIPNLIPEALPITRRLWPGNGNWLILAKSAVLTRTGIAAARIFQNAPSRNRQEGYSHKDKTNAFIERIFVEAFGTMGYMLAIHLGMDAFSKWMERYLPELPSMKNVKLPPAFYKQRPLFEQFQKDVDTVTQKIFGGRKGRIARIIFGDVGHPPASLYHFKVAVEKTGSYQQLPKALRDRFWNDFMPKRLEPAVQSWTKFAGRHWVVGILAGALFGGFVIQWFNDRIVSPVIIPILDKVLGLGDEKSEPGEKASQQPLFREASAPERRSMPQAQLPATTPATMFLAPQVTPHAQISPYTTQMTQTPGLPLWGVPGPSFAPASSAIFPPPPSAYPPPPMMIYWPPQPVPQVQPQAFLQQPYFNQGGPQA